MLTIPVYLHFIRKFNPFKCIIIISIFGLTLFPFYLLCVCDYHLVGVILYAYSFPSSLFSILIILFVLHLLPTSRLPLVFQRYYLWLLSIDVYLLQHHLLKILVFSIGLHLCQKSIRHICVGPFLSPPFFPLICVSIPLPITHHLDTIETE